MARLEILKDPNAILDYGFDWSDWLITDTIATSTWAVPSGLVLEDEAYDNTTAVIWLSGGTLGQTYRVTNTIITNNGRQEDRTLIVIMKER